MLGTMLMIAQAGPTTAEFIVSVGVAGVVGPSIAVLASRAADRRRFGHENKLKASDDLISRIDDVAVSLDALWTSSDFVRRTFQLEALKDRQGVGATVIDAEQAYLRTRAEIARLGTRPHADRPMLEKAEAAAGSSIDAVKILRRHLIRKAAAAQVTGEEPRGEASVAAALKALKRSEELRADYLAEARVSIGKLLATGR